jgi:hypothetical protein
VVLNVFKGRIIGKPVKKFSNLVFGRAHLNLQSLC